VSLQGDFYGAMDAFKTATDSWIASLPGPGTLNATQLDWLDSLVAKDGALSTSAPDVHDTFFAKSLLISQPSSNDSLAAWVSFMYGEGISSKIGWFAEIDSWGGQIAATSSSSTSFAHRNATFGYQLYSSSPNALPPYPDTQITFLNNMWATLGGSDTSTPQYTNYIDPTLGVDVWPTAYFGGNFERLTQIKTAVDPNNMFRFAQSIPLSTSVNSSSSGSGSGNGNGNGSSTTPQSSSSGASSSSTSTSTSTAPTQTSSSLSGPTKSLSMVMLLAAVGTVVSIVVT